MRVGGSLLRRCGMPNRGRHAKKIETVHWTLASPIEAVALSSGAAFAATATAAQHLPETLLRIRGEIIALINGVSGTDVGAQVFTGLILVPEGTGSTVLWGPSSDGDAPWIWWDVMHLVYDEFVTDVVAATEISSGRRIIDSKSMRKIRNQELQFVVENNGFTGLTNAAITMAATVRVLTGS